MSDGGCSFAFQVLSSLFYAAELFIGLTDFSFYFPMPHPAISATSKEIFCTHLRHSILLSNLSQMDPIFRTIYLYRVFTPFHSHYLTLTCVLNHTAHFWEKSRDSLCSTVLFSFSEQSINSISKKFNIVTDAKLIDISLMSTKSC